MCTKLHVNAISYLTEDAIHEQRSISMYDESRSILHSSGPPLGDIPTLMHVSVAYLSSESN